MTILPKSRSGRIRFAVILLTLFGICASYRLDRVGGYYVSAKREGDILFQSLPNGPLVDAIEGITQSEWSHCGMLLRKEGRWCVAEAIGQVRYTPLHIWLVRGRGSKVASYRLKEPPRGLGERLLAGVDVLEGKPYDFRYAPEDNAIYCSELVYKVYDRHLGLQIGRWESLGELNWRPHEAFIRGMEKGRLPLDRLMITPVGLTCSPLVEQVF